MNVEIYEKILKDMNFSIIIWDKKDIITQCIFTNGHDKTVKKDMDFKEYIKNNQNLKIIYNKLFETNKEQVKNEEKTKIKLFRLENTYYYEVRVLNFNNNSSYVFEMALLKNISSRLRKPLTAILGLISILEKTTLKYEQKTQIKKISISTLKIVELANDVIDIYNLKKNNVKLLSEKFKLDDTIIDSIQLINNFKSTKKINITNIVNEKLNHFVIGDKSRIQQILSSLLSISYDNTDYGSIIIEVDNYLPELNKISPFEYSEPKDNEINLIFKIRDTNTNFKKENYELIQAILGLSNKQNIKNDKFQFGLIISKYLCNLMRGNIWMTKNDDYGTVFYFNVILNK
jgi:signal transduction histidine kinase